MARPAKGTILTRQPDGSVVAGGESPPTDIYTVVATTSLKQIRAVRLEVLPDERFPGEGPGRGACPGPFPDGKRYTRPWSSIAWATFLNPAMFAPFT